MSKFQKVQAPNAIKQACPGTEVKRKGSYDNRLLIYQGIGHKSYLHPGSVSAHGDFNKCPEIDNIRELISAT